MSLLTTFNDFTFFSYVIKDFVYMHTYQCTDHRLIAGCTAAVANCVYKKRKACRTTENGGYCDCKKQ